MSTGEAGDSLGEDSLYGMAQLMASFVNQGDIMAVYEEQVCTHLCSPLLVVDLHSRFLFFPHFKSTGHVYLLSSCTHCVSCFFCMSVVFFLSLFPPFFRGQRVMLSRFEKTNAKLDMFNESSAVHLASALQNFKRHTQLLLDAKRDLHSIYRRIRYPTSKKKKKTKNKKKKGRGTPPLSESERAAKQP
jgi:hypothetical protein